MFLEERQAKILEMLNRDGKVLVKELAEIFGVTEDSIRKDLSSLELDGKLKRTYGGAVSLAEKLQMTEAHKRRISDVEAKRRIAAEAVKLMRRQDLIFLDISTISIAIAQLLERTETPYKILTNMIDVVVTLARNPKINLFFAGGQINHSRDGFVDVLNVEFMSSFRPDVSFVGLSGVDILRNSLTSRDTTAGVHKAKVLELCKTNYIIAKNRRGKHLSFRDARKSQRHYHGLETFGRTDAGGRKFERENYFGGMSQDRRIFYLNLKRVCYVEKNFW